MDCRTLGPLIENYLADELTTTTRNEAVAHLATCAACRARVRDFARLDSVLRELPRETVSPALALRIQQATRARLLRRRLGHALPVAIATLCSALLFVWLASETWLALQDRALWEFVTWFISVPELLWQHPADVLAAFADFAPIGGLVFTLGAAFSSLLLGMRLIEELRSPMQSVG